MVTEQDCFAEWKATEGAIHSLRFEENVRTDSYSSSPTPDEAIDSDIEVLTVSFENWMEKVHPEIDLTWDENNYPQIVIKYIDKMFDTVK